METILYYYGELLTYTDGFVIKITLDFGHESAELSDFRFSFDNLLTIVRVRTFEELLLWNYRLPRH
jgi:hypothetical protein